MTISNFVRSIQNIMRQDAGVDGDAQRISQLVWMLFLKVFDTKEEEWEVVEDDYTPIIPEKYQWRNWAGDEEGMTGNELLEFVDNELFVELSNLEIDEYTDERKILVKEVFADSYNYMKSGTLMRKVINRINQVDFDNYKERHAFNEIYETILKDLQSAGNSGEYYTPRAVTDFVIEMLDPKIEESVADFACGTGGFLVSSLEYRRNKYDLSVEDRENLQNGLHGVEKKPMPYMLGVTNLILHDIDTPDILHGNSLNKSLREFTEKDKFDVIAMNPPFGGTEQDIIQMNFPKPFQTSETADLFMTLIMYRLKEDGRAGVVLPDGFFFGTDNAKLEIKKKLFDEFNLHTIVRLPGSVFAPYTSIATNLLFFNKNVEGTDKVWYYELPLPEGYKAFSKTKPMQSKHFEEVRNWWNDREETERAWQVEKEEIVGSDYNLDINNPNVIEEDNHDPKELLRKYNEVQNEITGLQELIKEELKEVL
ncbi:class I SAM-dependent DNA methyltransferase [Halanaerobium kushneri]|uniref:site-specific DNA-methyltransferase (adenine-specific) n=1 Tax=Halanaerobium kushneri TaxID=56779 RepID=A0A1N6SMH0_9FIRM|nr:class I SAM-dependent DNA methyltransferase [Halanaerobium kushneri]SIQ42234.1 type I restriction enzyme M protein [Halanaerobium kushneri]